MSMMIRRVHLRIRTPDSQKKREAAIGRPRPARYGRHGKDLFMMPVWEMMSSGTRNVTPPRRGLMQRGADRWEAAGWLGLTLEQLEDGYGHHRPDFEEEAAEHLAGVKDKKHPLISGWQKLQRG